ncbi:poly(ADP-ribose) glycohydrolase isoform X1 [Maniola hyperantus]|uniref:poly(ADP-ribose) glycohydrolase isoform X1 n=2 Tax=Aphantopus hyperantus TaxID=2795564 RepID=UPI00212DBC85
MIKTRNLIKCFSPNFNLLKSIVPCTTMASDNDWKGVPMSHIIGSQSPWGAPEFPLVQPGYNHAVLYHIPGSGTQVDRPPKPQVARDKWDQEHIRMPFSKHSLYPVPKGSGETDLKSRWEMIQDALNKPIGNSKELATAILSYNSQFKDKWKFRSLHSLFESLDEDEAQYFFDVTLPEIAKLALALPKLIQAPIPLLKQHKNRSVSLSQQQISSLLANAFFCTFPRRNSHKKDAEYSSYPFINFNALYNCTPSTHILEKIKCLCHYFRRVCRKVPVGVVTFSRRSVPPKALPDWQSSAKPLAELPVHVDPQSTIEDAHGLIQVDFANKFLGGGVLGYGSVQEEIRFVICPELMISMLFTEYLRPNEALMMIGCEQFCTYTGYGHSFQWSGDHNDETPYDSSGRRRCAVLAIDALPFHTKLQEHRKEAVNRELNKAWVGFSFYTSDDPGPHYPGVATGNWGCGAFGGTAALKALLQAMALTQAGRPMAYYTFGDAKLRDDIMRVYNLLEKHSVTVGGLYGLILDYCKTDILRCNLYKFLEKILDGKDSSSISQSSTPNQPEPMDCNAETEQYDLPLTVELALDRSPDIFDDDDDALFITPAKLKVNGQNESRQKDLSKVVVADDELIAPSSSKEKADIDHKTSNSDHKMAESDHKMSKSDHKIVESEVNTDHKTPKNIAKKSATDQRMSTSPADITEKSKTPNHTSRLFDEMEKIDKSSGNLNLKSPQSSIFRQRPKQAEMAENSETCNRTSRLLDEMEKLDKDSGKLNLKSPQKSAMDVEDKELSEVNPDVKKKLARKITDYFSKKPI